MARVGLPGVAAEPRSAIVACDRVGLARARRCRARTIEPLAGGEPGEDAERLVWRLFQAQPRHWLRIVPGRRTFVWPQDPGVVVKLHHHHQLLEAMREVLRGAAPRSPGRREAENLLELAACGVPVPRCLGWCEQAGSPLARERFSAAWMERVEHDENLRQLATRAPREAVARWLEELARRVASLHAQGWYHRDLYLDHWIVAGERLVLLDVGRARRERRPRERWFVKDVAALLHSCPQGVEEAARRRFLELYLDLRGVSDPGRRRAFALAAAAKARRMAAHEPRFVDRTSKAT
jgi:tRNA A-37 threonylcarbamoyl transferase component Bud32